MRSIGLTEVSVTGQRFHDEALCGRFETSVVTAMGMVPTNCLDRRANAHGRRVTDLLLRGKHYTTTLQLVENHPNKWCQISLVVIHLPTGKQASLVLRPGGWFEFASNLPEVNTSEDAVALIEKTVERHQV